MPRTRQATGELSAGRLTLAGGGLRLDFALTEGTFSIARGRRTVLRDVCARVGLAERGVVTSAGRAWAVAERPRRFEDANGQGVRAAVHSSAEGARLLLEASVYDDQPYLVLRIGLANLDKALEHVLTLDPVAPSRANGNLTLAGSPREWRWYRHGWQSWAPTGSISAAQQDMDVRPPVNAPALPLKGRGRFASDEVGALLDPESGEILLLGFVTARHQWTQVRLDAGRRTIEAIANADGMPVRAGETLWSERLLIDASDEAEESFARYADALGREMGARTPPSPAGWCSWYYYFTSVSERDVLTNLRYLQEHRRELPVQLVQIDDGYQAEIGDWRTPNEKFPRGMAALARDIKDAGYTPGLWLAPFIAGERSRLFAEHPDWCTKNATGEPAFAMRNWEQQCYGLDCTNPRVERWLHDVFREVTEGWGYEYVKIDFLYAGALAGQRHDKNATRIDAYRRGLEAIRSVVGERFILGCGAPMAPSVGVIDAQRIGPDVAPWWRYRRSRIERERGRPDIGGEPSTENALRNTLARQWMHGRLWANDADCLIAREDRTKLTLPEAQSLGTAIALSGGAFLISDDMSKWPKRRLELVSSLLPVMSEGAVVPDLMRETMPSTMELELRRPLESWRVVGRFNWSGRRATLRVALPPGRWHAFEFWEGRYYGQHEGELALPEVPAHGVRLLALRKVLGRPQLVGTTFHYSMGAAEIAGTRWDGRSRTLHIDLQPVARAGGEVCVAAAKSYRFADATFEGRPMAPVRREGRAIVFRLRVAGSARLSVRFA